MERSTHEPLCTLKADGHENVKPDYVTAWWNVVDRADTAAVRRGADAGHRRIVPA